MDGRPGASQPFPGDSSTYSWHKLFLKDSLKSSSIQSDTLTHDNSSSVCSGSNNSSGQVPMFPVPVSAIWSRVDGQSENGLSFPPYDACFQGF